MNWRSGQAYGQDLRDRVLSADGSISQVARRFNVSESYVSRARSRRRLGQDAAGVQCNHMPLKLSGLEQALCAQVQAAPEQTLAQLCDWVRTAHGVQVSVTAMWKTLGRLGMSLKKRPLPPPNERVPT